jgi:hypothetical protein
MTDKELPLRIRMLAIITELEPIKKIKKGEGGAIYAHYAHNDVQQAVMSLLPKYAIFMNTEPVIDKENGILTMKVRFEDAYGKEEAIVTSTPVIIGNLKDEKGTGSAMSYALKYSLMRIFGLGGENDPDDLSKYISKAQAIYLDKELKSLPNGQAVKNRILEICKIKDLFEMELKDFDMMKKNIQLAKEKAVLQPADETKTQ